MIDTDLLSLRIRLNLKMCIPFIRLYNICGTMKELQLHTVKVKSTVWLIGPKPNFINHVIYFTI